MNPEPFQGTGLHPPGRACDQGQAAIPSAPRRTEDARVASTASSSGKKLRPREEPGGLSGEGSGGEGKHTEALLEGHIPRSQEVPGAGPQLFPEVTEANGHES